MTPRRDIAEQEHALETLQESDHFKQTVLDSLPAHIAVLDSDGRVIAVNNSWRRFAKENGDPGDAHVGVGIDYLEVCESASSRNAPLAQEALEGIRAVLSGHCHQFVLEYPCHSPTQQRWFLMHVVPARFGGASLGHAEGRSAAVVTHLDITERKQMEQQLEAATITAESAVRAKDQFIAALSHELRTPLTPVLTMVQMLQASHAQDGDSESLEMIHRNVALELCLIDDLLDLTRISRGKLALHMAPVDLHELQKQVIQICESDVRSKALRLSVELAATQHHVRGDAARLQQILWNLLKNAVKFTPSGGCITIRTENPAKGRIAVAVTDTGVGIQPDLLPRIFKAFEQGEYARQFGGMGLGLAISRQIAELHEGTLRAQSEGRNKGACFTLELATLSGDEPAAPQAARFESHAPRTKGGRVLLVEDHPDTSRALRRLLTNLGYEVRTADTVAMALQNAEAEPFDVLVATLVCPTAPAWS